VLSDANIKTNFIFRKSASTLMEGKRYRNPEGGGREKIMGAKRDSQGSRKQ